MAAEVVGCHPSRWGGRLTRTNEVRFDPTPAPRSHRDPVFIHYLYSRREKQRPSH